MSKAMSVSLSILSLAIIALYVVIVIKPVIFDQEQEYSIKFFEAAIPRTNENANATEIKLQNQNATVLISIHNPNLPDGMTDE